MLERTRSDIVYKLLVFQFVISLLWMLSMQNYIAIPQGKYLIKENITTLDANASIFHRDEKHKKENGGVLTNETNILNVEENSILWNPVGPWEAPPEGFYDDDQTGSLENCSKSLIPPSHITVPQRWDSGEVVVSCHMVRYRAPKWKFQDVGPIILGVLSAAGGTGPERRRYIRSTWANNLRNCFFLVAGPWEEIEKEYMFYQDMIWIDHKEIYQGENSVLTFKTISYFNIAHILAKRPEDGGFIHAVKTDDDSYVNIDELEKMLLGHEGVDRYYWGHCPQYKVAPLRDPDLKWSMTYTTYPEPMFPLYCQGAGFGLSRKLLDCAVGRHHVSKFRYIPFEDVAIGIIVERCGKKPTMTNGVRVFRADTSEERERVKHNVKVAGTSWLPPPKMKGKYIQHRVDTEADMINHHLSLKLKPGTVKPIPNDFVPLRSDTEISYIAKGRKRDKV